MRHLEERDLQTALQEQAAQWGPMDPAVKEAWLNRLEDPNAKQAQGRLRIGDSYCCLGLLCEVVSEVKGVGKWQQGQLGDAYFIFETENSEREAMPPTEVCMASKLSAGVAAQLSIANDDGAKFKEIAEFIREKL